MRSISHDEPDIDTNTANNIRESGGSNLLVTILLVLTVAFIAYYAYMKSQDNNLSDFSLKKVFSIKSEAKDKQKVFTPINSIPYESNENTVFAVYKDYIVKAGSEGIDLLDKKGIVMWHYSIAISKPIIRNNGKDVIIADINGKEFVVINGKAVKWKGKADSKIINADISPDGHVAILSNAKRYGGEVVLYDSLGIELFKAFIGDNSPIAAKVSPSVNKLTVNCINTSGSRAQTYIKLLDGREGEKLAGNILGPLGSIYPVMWYAGDELIYMAGDTAITIVDKNGEQQWTKEYEAIFSTCMVGSRNIAAAVKDKSGFVLKIFGTNGRELVSSGINSEVRNISSFGNIIAVNTVREVDFINDRGNVLGKYTSKTDILDVFFLNKYEAVVISKSSVTLISINN